MSTRFDFAGLTRPKTPNTYLLAPPGLCRSATPDREAPVFAVPPQELFEAAKAAVSDLPRTEEIRADEGERAIAFIAKTKLMGFKDDVDIRVLPAEGGSSLAVYSRSRIGKSDLGANKKRVEALLNEIEARVSAR
jgi:uncharacterized protein (DUF1499 family)